MRCSFCKATNSTVKVCFWPILSMQTVAIANLEVGDLIQTGWYQYDRADRRQRREGGRILSIVPDERGLLRVEVRANKISDRFNTQSFVNGWSKDATIFALRPVNCARPACELHHQERSPDHFICFDHWHAWSQPKEAA